MEARTIGTNAMTEVNDDERTNSLGLFNSAEAWRLSAMALQTQRVQSGHADQPVVSLLSCRGTLSESFVTSEARREKARRHRPQNEAAGEESSDHGADNYG